MAAVRRESVKEREGVEGRKEWASMLLRGEDVVSAQTLTSPLITAEASETYAAV